jgi:cytochrome c biogenesis protein CcmG/thiol:disulfide interchange protein DsbE
MRRWIGVAALLLATTMACSSHSSIEPGPGGTNPSLAKLIAKADLRPCPKSSSTPASGGLPNVTLACLGNGPEVHMAGLTGKPTVVNIWGSWCPPCQAEMRYMSSAFDKDRAQVMFLGVDTEDQADSALDFDAHVTPPVHYPSVFDEKREVALGLHDDAPPYTVFVSPTGQIVHTEHGAYTSTAQLQSAIATYLHVTA